MKPLIITLIALPLLVWAQPQAENHIPYIETTAMADTLVIPDLIYLSIQLLEHDRYSNISVEQLEKRMFDALRKLEIDIEKQLKPDASSSTITSFLHQKDIHKGKHYELKLHDATTAMQVLAAFEEKGISNVHLSKTEYSKLEKLQLQLLSNAVAKAKQRAHAMAKPLGQQVAEAIVISDMHSQFVGYEHNPLDEVVEAYVVDVEEITQTDNITLTPQKIQVSVQIRFRLSK